MNKPGNRRFRETEEHLKETLLTLLLEGRFLEELSIKEICERGNINRSTFYAHYSIPEDILREIETSTLQDTQNFIANMSGSSDKNVISLLSYIKQNRETFRVLLAQNSPGDFPEKLTSQIVPIFMKIEQTPYTKYLFNYIKSYSIEGAKAVIISWINDSCPESEEKIAALIIELSKKVIDTAFTFK